MPPDAWVLQLVLAGVSGALVSFVLQGVRSRADANRRALTGARVVRLELIRNVATAEMAVKVRRRMSASARVTFRRDAFDRLSGSLASGLNDKYLSSLVGFYAMHEYAAETLFGTDNGASEPLSDVDAAWLERWILSAENAEAIINVAHATWWQRLIWRGHWAELDRRLAEEDKRADADEKELVGASVAPETP